MFALALFMMCLFVGPLCAEKDSDAVFAQFSMKGTEMRPLHCATTGRDYLLYVDLPPSYATHPERKYPVVYLTDAYWTFAMMRPIRLGLLNDGAVPEYIVVGIGYLDETLDYVKEREYELTPAVVDEAPDARTGGSAKFLEAFKTEIIPYVEKSLRADPEFRVYAGHSLGGSFGLYAMYEAPGLFQGIVATSPAVPYPDRWFFKREYELRKRAVGPDHNGHFSLKTRLFMSVGDREWPSFQGDIKAFNEIIGSAGYTDFAYQFRIIDGDAHDGNIAEAYNRGLRFVFENYVHKDK